MNIESYQNLNLKPYNTYGIKSIGKNVYFPKNEDELICLLKTKKGIVIGNASNILFSSSGVEEDLIFLKNLNKIKDNGETVYAEAGVKSPVFSNYALDCGFTGFEFLIPIPSTIGGNIYMNASAHGEAISDYLVSVRVWDKDDNKVLELQKDEISFLYRKTTFNQNPNKYVILGATFKKRKKDKSEISTLMENIKKIRWEKQPSLKTPNAGSVFKNPEGLSAGKLIEEIGFKGKKSGGAMVSLVHANFIVNEDNATSDDIVNLMYEIQESVYNKFKVRLEPEIIYIGKNTEKTEKIWKK